MIQLEAQNAFFLILRNAIRFGALAMLGSMLHFIGGEGIAESAEITEWIST